MSLNHQAFPHPWGGAVQRRLQPLAPPSGKLARCLPARPWLETPEEYRTRLKAAVAEVNATHDVDSLCKELPARVAQLSLAEGGRLAK